MVTVTSPLACAGCKRRVTFTRDSPSRVATSCWVSPCTKYNQQAWIWVSWSFSSEVKAVLGFLGIYASF